MQITCNRSELSRVFDLAASPVKVNSPKEVLRNVKMLVRGGQATLMGTDAETGVTTGLAVQQTGSDEAVLLDVPKVRQILRETEGSEVTLSTDGPTIKIVSGCADFELGSANPDEYPTVKPFDHENYFEIAGSELERLVRVTSYAVDANSTRYAMEGVLFTFSDDDVLRVVATDGRRASFAETQVRFVGDRSAASSVWPLKAICSPGSLGIIASSVKNCEQVKLSVLSCDVVVESPVCTVTTRQVEGRFPNAAGAIPKGYMDFGSFEFEPAQMLSCIKQASILADKETCGMSFEVTPGQLRLSAKSAMKGASKVQMPIIYGGAAVTIMLDYQYMNEFLRAVGDQLVTMRFDSSTTAVVLTTADKNLYVLMPMASEQPK